MIRAVGTDLVDVTRLEGYMDRVPGLCERLFTPAELAACQKRAASLGARLAAKEAGAQVALFGHTHRSFCRNQGDVLLINPGACGGSSGTYAVLETGHGARTCEIRPVQPQE